jgi:hypothetical protein
VPSEQVALTRKGGVKLVPAGTPLAFSSVAAGILKIVKL